MRRYKGRASTKVMVRDFPHVVEIPAPIGGLGKQIDAMHAFHGQRGTQARLAPRRRDDERDYLRWCFASREIAEAFAAEFSGELIG
jgi:hypothetical protein